MPAGPLYDATRWESGADELPVWEAASILEKIDDGLADPVEHVDALWWATAVMCEHPAGDPVLALRAMNAAIPWLRRSAGVEQTRVHAIWCLLQARVHRGLGHDRQAFRIAYDALFWLEGQAGGSAGLARMLRDPAPTLCAEVSVGVLETYARTLPRAGIAGDTMTRCYSAGRYLVESYVLGGSRPVPYARSSHLAAGWLPLLAAAEPRNRRMRAALEGVLVSTPGIIGVEPLESPGRASRAASLTYATRVVLAA